MNGLGNHLENRIQKIEKKTIKNRSEIAACEQKPLPRKRIFVQTPYSPSTLKLERKNFKPQNHSFCAPFSVST